MPQKDPIKPKLSLTKKPNFKKGELENDFNKVSLNGVFDDISLWDVSQVSNISDMFKNCTTFNPSYYNLLI